MGQGTASSRTTSWRGIWLTTPSAIIEQGASIESEPLLVATTPIGGREYEGLFICTLLQTNLRLSCYFAAIVRNRANTQDENIPHYCHILILLMRSNSYNSRETSRLNRWRHGWINTCKQSEIVLQLKSWSLVDFALDKCWCSWINEYCLQISSLFYL